MSRYSVFLIGQADGADFVQRYEVAAATVQAAETLARAELESRGDRWVQTEEIEQLDAHGQGDSVLNVDGRIFFGTPPTA